MRMVKKVELVFENCEVIALKPYCFLELTLDRLKTNLHRCAANSIGKFTTAKDIVIYLYKDADKTINEFGNEAMKTTVFERIKGNDITSIDIFYEDGTEETYYTSWNDKDEYTNFNQTTKITKNGNLLCIISKNAKDLEKQYIKDEDEMNNSAKNIYELGRKFDKDPEFENDSTIAFSRELKEIKNNIQGIMDEHFENINLQTDWFVSLCGNVISERFKTREQAIKWAEFYYSLDDDRISIESETYEV